MFAICSRCGFAAETTLDDLAAGGWTLAVTCGACGRIAELSPNYLKHNGAAFKERRITLIRWRCRCGEGERIRLSVFEEQHRGDKSRHKVIIIADWTQAGEQAISKTTDATLTAALAKSRGGAA